MNKINNQTLALAGILQSVMLVDQLASKGECDTDCSIVSLNSITSKSANVYEVFESPVQLSIGMAALRVALGKQTKSIQTVIFYALSLINLEKKLMKNSALLGVISTEINALKKQEFFEITHSNSIARLGELYKTTLGELSPRIMVKGEQLHLSNQRTANHIRALLLAGIRAVSLWKSQGGKTWHLILNKKKILSAIDALDRIGS